MSSDPTIIKALRDIFNSILGVDAVYTPVGGAALPIRVLLEKNVLLQPISMTAQVFERGTTIEVIMDDVGAEPDKGSTFVIGTETFTVQAPLENDGDTAKMIVT